MILLGHDEAIADWVGRQNGKTFQPPYTAIGSVDDTGHLRAGFVFTAYNGTSIEVSVAGSGISNRGLWRAVLAYVFEQMKCSRLEIHTREDNRKVRKRAPQMGFTFEGVCRRFYGHENAFLYSLTTDDLPAFRARWRL